MFGDHVFITMYRHFLRERLVAATGKNEDAPTLLGHSIIGGVEYAPFSIVALVCQTPKNNPEIPSPLAARRAD